MKNFVKLNIFRMNFFISVSPRTHQEEGSWGNQTQIHRHFLQDGSWSFPDQEGQNGLYGTSQEGRRQGRGCCLNLNIWLSSCFREIKKSIENIFFVSFHFGFTWVKLQGNRRVRGEFYLYFLILRYAANLLFTRTCWINF